jgi:hypothetical protein
MGVHGFCNDGWKDLLIAQGDLDTIELTFPNLHYREPMLLARNTGQGFIESLRIRVASCTSLGSHAAAIGDLDNDGRLDAVVTTNLGSVYILHNEIMTQNQPLPDFETCGT